MTVALAGTCPEMQVRDVYDPAQSNLIPELARWSDVAFLAYQEQCRVAKRPVSGLRYVVRTNIINKRTYQTICDILNRKERSLPPVANSWRLDFDVEEAEAKALIATPNGYGVAWLLLQRRLQLSWKAITKVTIIACPSHLQSREPNAYGPHLVFEITDRLSE